MSRTLFVVVGAGASYDAASSWPTSQIRPPLVKDLFHPHFQEILAAYPLAQSAAPEIRDALIEGREEKAVSLEHHLRTVYRDSKDPYDRRRFYSIALYLQNLLWNASQGPVHFDNIDRLVAILLRHFAHVCFVTLNYDTILDQALGKLDPLRRLEDYTQDRWSLIKLHGSVDWGYAPRGGMVDVDNPPPDLEHRLYETIVKCRRDVLQRGNEPPRYGEASDPNKHFPALTVPVGEEDEIACPPSHQSFFKDRLRNEDELDLLILGYSAYDRTVIQLIGDCEKRIRNLTVVNANREAAAEVVRRLRRLLPQSMNGTRVNLADLSFGEWCQESLQAFATSPVLTNP